jgi:hypothetical protein
MIIAAEYSFNGGSKAVKARYPDLLKEIKTAIAGIDASKHRTKKSKEKTMKGKMLYSPKSLNKAFKKILNPSRIPYKILPAPLQSQRLK